MTQVTEPVSSEQDLLQKLLQQGLTPSAGEYNSTRYHTLVEVLFQQCVLKPASFPVLPVILEHANLSLSVLRGQVAEHPELLSHSSDNGQLYKWILPRLVHAACMYDEVEGASGLSDDLIEAAAGVLRTLSRDLADSPENSYAVGPVRVAMLVRQLTVFAKGMSSMDGQELTVRRHTRRRSWALAVVRLLRHPKCSHIGNLRSGFDTADPGDSDRRIDPRSLLIAQPCFNGFQKTVHEASSPIRADSGNGFAGQLYEYPRRRVSCRRRPNVRP